MTPEECTKELATLVEAINPVLSAVGFTFESDCSGVSSGGSFSSGFYAISTLKIGLIYRSGGLGCVIYEVNGRSASHDDVMQLLCNKDDSRLTFDSDKMVSIDKRGSDTVAALLFDLEKFVIPKIRESRDDFLGIVHAAFLIHMKTLLGDQYERWLTSASSGRN
jgi:hypothetical protein